MGGLEFITDIAALEALYNPPSAPAVRKVVTRITPLYRTWIERSRYCVVSTVGPEGTDGSPRGDDGPVVRILDTATLALPDWRGNNRLDTLRNIVNDGRISLMFMVPGSNTVMRVNGRAQLTTNSGVCQSFEQNGHHPTTVIVIKIGEIYSQCARATMRADLWNRDDAAGLPTVGALLAEATQGEEGGDAYDRAWPDRARASMW